MRAQTLLIPTPHEITAHILAGTLDDVFRTQTAEYIANFMPRYIRVKPYHRVARLEPASYCISVNQTQPLAVKGNASTVPLYCKSNTVENAIFRVSEKRVREEMRLWLKLWSNLYATRSVGVEWGYWLDSNCPADVVYTLAFRSG